jgi:hypothetical protein
MHQPNMFVNTFLGYTMWDYESDAPSMWPEKQVYPTHEEQVARYWSATRRVPRARGKWSDIDFLEKVSELNPTLHRHPVCRLPRPRLELPRQYSSATAPATCWTPRVRWSRTTIPTSSKKAVHMSSIHLDKGMHCVDCHFAQDMHTAMAISYGEVAAGGGD